MSQLPKISVIIPTLNRTEYLISTISDLLKQDYPDFEVILIDQSTDEDEKKKLQEYGQSIKDCAATRNVDIIYKYQNELNVSKARNTGIKISKGDILLFLDDDIKINSPKFLFYHGINYSTEKHIAGVAGQILTADQSVRYDRFFRSRNKRVGWLYFPFNYNKRAIVAAGMSGNLSVWKWLAVKVGGMDENYKYGAFREESDFCIRCAKLGYYFIFEPRASVIHLSAPTGGIRIHKDSEYPFYHVVSECYFILKNVAVWDILDHLFAALRRQVWYVNSDKSIAGILKAIWRLCCGFKIAREILKRNRRCEKALKLPTI